MPFNDELASALRAAKAAGEIQIDGAEKITRIELKNDRSPVTEIDRKCEQIIKDILLKDYPGDGFLGEETGSIDGTSGRRWIVDPLDGTRPYIRGIPTHSVLIALECGDEQVTGVMHLPSMNITCWASQGDGAFCNGKPVRVSSVNNLSQAMGSALGFIEKDMVREGKDLFRCMHNWDYMYGFMDAYTYVCIACGKIDVCVNLLDKAWDCAAAACIVREAGGEFTDIKGSRSVHCGSTVLTNGLLHKQVLSFFND